LLLICSTVSQVYDEVLVEDATNNLVVKINQLGSGLHIGERELVSLSNSYLIVNVDALLQGLVSTQSSSLMNHADTVIGVVHIVYAIAWLAINQSVSQSLPSNFQYSAHTLSWLSLILIKLRNDSVLNGSGLEKNCISLRC